MRLYRTAMLFLHNSKYSKVLFFFFSKPYTIFLKCSSPMQNRMNIDGLEIFLNVILFVWLVVFLMSSSTTRLYRGRVQRLSSDNFMCCHTQSGEIMTSVSAGHIILTPTQPVWGASGHSRNRTQDLLTS